MIYTDNFISLLKQHLSPVKINDKEIICRCPWCEKDEDKKHFHLYISLDKPIFHCFHSICNQSGNIGKLIRKLIGHANTSDFVKESSNYIEANKVNVRDVDIRIPDQNYTRSDFYKKISYIEKRMHTPIDKLGDISFILDIRSFFNINKDVIITKLDDYKIEYLHNNFIGFLTHKKSQLVLRNINSNSNFRYIKIKLFNLDNPYIDYFKIDKKNSSDNIILSEGIFDILTDHVFNFTGLGNDVKLYACCLSTSYKQLIKSIIFNEQIFRFNIFILSDSDVPMSYYHRVRSELKYAICKFTVIRNCLGKDFNETVPRWLLVRESL